MSAQPIDNTGVVVERKDSGAVMRYFNLIHAGIHHAWKTSTVRAPEPQCLSVQYELKEGSTVVDPGYKMHERLATLGLLDNFFLIFACTLARETFGTLIKLM